MENESRLTVADLAAVPLQLSHFRVLLSIGFGIIFVRDFRPIPGLKVLPQLSEKVVPDLFPSRIIERRIANRYMDAGLECLVDVADTIRREEEDTLKVFHGSEKD